MGNCKSTGGIEKRCMNVGREAGRGAMLGIGLLLLLCLIAGGCGRQENQETETAEQTVSWKTEGFAAPKEPETGLEYYAEDYERWDATQGERETYPYDIESGACGGLFWNLSEGELKGADTPLLLTLYDAKDGSCKSKDFTPSGLGLSGELGVLQDMDMPDPNHILLRWGEYEKDGEGLYHQTADRMAYIDLAITEEGLDLALSETGSEDSSAGRDFLEIYLEKGILQDKPAELPLCQQFQWKSCGNGGFCIYSPERLFLFGSAGDLWLEEEGGRGRQFLEPLQTQDGQLIVPVYSKGSGYEFLWADAEAKELRSLAQIEAGSPYIDRMCGMVGNDVYYQSREGTEDAAAAGIVRWDIRSGGQTRIFDLKGNGIDANYEIQVALPEGGVPCMRLAKYKSGENREWLVRLTREKPEEDRNVRVADLTGFGPGDYAEKCAALASLDTPNYLYTYEDCSSEEARDRVFAELSRGEGPDLMYVKTADLKTLEEKGLLLDLTGLIPEGTKAALLPAVLEIGAMDGKLAGVPARAAAETLVVSRDIWDQDSWKLEDVIGLMEDGKLEGTLSSNLGNGGSLSPLDTTMTLLRYSLGDSFLIDWEKRESHFEDDRFVKLLEIVRNGQAGAFTGGDGYLNGGNMLLWAYFTSEGDFIDFWGRVEQEKGGIVGFPDSETGGSYLIPAEGVIVANAGTGRPEAVSCFLETLLGEELQSRKDNLSLSVRKIVPEELLVEGEDGKFRYLGGPEAAVLEDGSTSIHRGASFLENCIAPPAQFAAIQTILSEEIRNMLAEGRSAEDTAEIIDNRVQLYLDEQE